MLDLRNLGPLLVDAPAQPGRPAHVSAASGLVRCGAKLYVVADDEAALAVFDAGDPSSGRFEAFAHDELPLPKKERKALKPDLEALAKLSGGLLAIGSGSTENRDRGWFWPLQGDEVSGAAREISLSPLYAELRQRLPELNIEGCALLGGRMWLAQRGNGADSKDALVELHATDTPPGADAIAGIRPYELGEIDGVPLTFTDLAPGPDGYLLFTAAAENTDSTYHDGECVGAAVGLLDPHAGVIAGLWRLPTRHKVEGVDTAADGSLLLVADADDAEQPAPLLSASLPG